MLKVEHLEQFNVHNAIRGMRNPLNSWDRSDSTSDHVGKNDLDLMRRLYKAGSEHRKYLRQIFVSLDITAPLYWWKEFDTYKVGTTSNSCSTMHTLHKRDLTPEDFSIEYLDDDSLNTFNEYLEMLNSLRRSYITTKNKNMWYKLIQMLPSSYNQKRTITMSMENVANIVNQREHHKLDEWHTLVDAFKNGTIIYEIVE